MTKSKEFNPEKLAVLYDRAWNDKAFAARLDSDPRAALEEIYGAIPQDIEVRIVRDTANTKHLHIPVAPKEQEASYSDLLGAQGGTTTGCLTANSTAYCGTLAVSSYVG